MFKDLYPQPGLFELNLVPNFVIIEEEVLWSAQSQVTEQEKATELTYAQRSPLHSVSA